MVGCDRECSARPARHLAVRVPELTVVDSGWDSAAAISDYVGFERTYCNENNKD